MPLAEYKNNRNQWNATTSEKQTYCKYAFVLHYNKGEKVLATRNAISEEDC